MYILYVCLCVCSICVRACVCDMCVCPVCVGLAVHSSPPHQLDLKRVVAIDTSSMTSQTRYFSNTRQTCYMRWNDLSPHPTVVDEGDVIISSNDVIITMTTDPTGCCCHILVNQFQWMDTLDVVIIVRGTMTTNCVSVTMVMSP